MKKVLMTIGVFLTISVLSFLVWFLFLHKKIVINNYDKEITVSFNTSYTDTVPEVCYGSIVFCKKLAVEVDSNLDTSVLGDYQIAYHFKYLDKNETIVKNIKVVDTKKPELKADGVIKLCPNGKIISDNYESIDDYDGDITSLVKIIEEDGLFYLESTDSSGNMKRLLVDILEEDTIKPEIKLTGGKIYLSLNEKYQEKGFQATDNCDGDVTDRVTITNNINNQKVGNYQVIYRVTDESGNETRVTRDVSVIGSNNVIYPTGKTIYLTFDDGPGPYTAKLLNILDKYNVKATFFVTNQFPSYQKYIKEAYNRGHSVGIHTYSHKFSIYSSVDTYFNDLNKMSTIIKNLTGEDVKIVRFPGGSSNTISRNYQKGIMQTLANELTSRGYSYFDWNLDSCDAGGLTTSSAVSNQVIKHLDGSNKMILMHDIKKYSVNAVESIIQNALSKGYTFQKIDIHSPTFHHKINN